MASTFLTAEFGISFMTTHAAFQIILGFRNMSSSDIGNCPPHHMIMGHDKILGMTFYTEIPLGVAHGAFSLFTPGVK
jgi:hypothetical protein